MASLKELSGISIVSLLWLCCLEYFYDWVKYNGRDVAGMGFADRVGSGRLDVYILHTDQTDMDIRNLCTRANGKPAQAYSTKLCITSGA